MQLWTKKLAFFNEHRNSCKLLMKMWLKWLTNAATPFYNLILLWKSADSVHRWLSHFHKMYVNLPDWANKPMSAKSAKALCVPRALIWKLAKRAPQLFGKNFKSFRQTPACERRALNSPVQVYRRPANGVGQTFVTNTKNENTSWAGRLAVYSRAHIFLERGTPLLFNWLRNTFNFLLTNFFTIFNKLFCTTVSKGNPSYEKSILSEILFLQFSIGWTLFFHRMKCKIW